MSVGRKSCPYCLADIDARAARCDHCGEAQWLPKPGGLTKRDQIVLVVIVLFSVAIVAAALIALSIGNPSTDALSKGEPAPRGNQEKIAEQIRLRGKEVNKRLLDLYETRKQRCANLEEAGYSSRMCPPDKPVLAPE